MANTMHNDMTTSSSR